VFFENSQLLVEQLLRHFLLLCLLNNLRSHMSRREDQCLFCIFSLLGSPTLLDSTLLRFFTGLAGRERLPNSRHFPRCCPFQ
jgi:hypothetical protein